MQAAADWAHHHGFINDDERGLHHDFGVWLEGLAPFNPDTLQHFVYLERPHDSDEADGGGFGFTQFPGVDAR